MSVRTEPVALAGAVRALLAVLVAFGIGLTSGQVAAVVVAVEVISGLWVRHQVTPDANIPTLSADEVFDMWVSLNEEKADDGSAE